MNWNNPKLNEKVKYDTQKVSDKFQKRDFVLATELSTPYPQYVTFQLTQDKCSVIDSINEGATINVKFNLRGREWNGAQGIKYFNTLEAWRVEVVAKENVTPNTPLPDRRMDAISDNDDLPF
jgi:hypothetical protein